MHKSKRQNSLPFLTQILHIIELFGAFGKPLTKGNPELMVQKLLNTVKYIVLGWVLASLFVQFPLASRAWLLVPGPP